MKLYTNYVRDKETGSVEGLSENPETCIPHAIQQIVDFCIEGSLQYEFTVCVDVDNNTCESLDLSEEANAQYERDMEEAASWHEHCNSYNEEWRNK